MKKYRDIDSGEIWTEEEVTRTPDGSKYGSKQLIYELSKMPPMVIATAYLHALNYTLYGEDVTEKWLTATQNASALEKAYRKGYHDAMERVNQASKGTV